MWTKGESGNPKGAPKRRLITGHIERALMEAAKEGNATKARKIAEKVVELAEAGDRWAIQFVTERTEGKPDQYVSIGRAVRELADEELNDIAAGRSPGAAEEKGGAEEPQQLH